ncbi:CBS domain-containing protein [Amaricoccus tamworthensis]|uniref:CBS domain-containing protein n=1 Tax=Amaricoccus tamworthensis TaxID=57002 RepID=UPI003C7EC8D2
MIVRNIIQSKKITDIISVKPTDTVMSAAQVLSRHRIGAVVVSSDGKTVDGILSERDIVKNIGSGGVDCMDKNVSELMTSQVIQCSPDDTALSAMETMSNGRFRHMPVTEDGVMVGLISIGDVVNARISEMQEENSALTGMISNSW